MHVNRGLLFWGVALVTAGVVALAGTQGVIDTSVLVGAWRLWPLVLIAIGLSVILSRTPMAWIGTLVAALIVGIAGGALIAAGPGFASCNGEPTSTDTATGEFSGPSVRVELQLTCGELDLAMADGSGWRAETSVEGGNQPSRQGDASSLSIRSEGTGLPFDRNRQEWSVQLGRDVAYELDATLNAGEARLDTSGGHFSSLQLTNNAGSTHLIVTGATIEDLNAQLNAGSLDIQADAGTELSGSLGANAGTMNLCVPADTGLRISVESSVAFSHNLDERGLAESDDTFTSANFDTADSRIDLELHGNAATFNLNPEEGC